MNSIFKFRTYQLGFLFAKPYLWISFLITLFMLFSGRAIFNMPHLNTMILTSKILFYLGLFLFYFEIGLRKRLTFYQNFGISKTVLFVLALLFDTIITFTIVNLILVF
ncbi:hypothetical protein DHD32_07645 [Arenibacter sp. TNZ]|nr:hypothetical protein [Arenibacter sp. TNZ]